MLNLTDQDKADLMTMEKSGDFGLINTYAGPGSEFDHLSDAELLAHLDNQGDFDSILDPYRPDLIVESGTQTVIIQAKKSEPAEIFPNIEQFFSYARQ